VPAGRRPCARALQGSTPQPQPPGSPRTAVLTKTSGRCFDKNKRPTRGRAPRDAAAGTGPETAAAAAAAPTHTLAPARVAARPCPPSPAPRGVWGGERKRPQRGLCLGRGNDNDLKRPRGRGSPRPGRCTGCGLQARARARAWVGCVRAQSWYGVGGRWRRDKRARRRVALTSRMGGSTVVPSARSARWGGGAHWKARLMAAANYGKHRTVSRWRTPGPTPPYRGEGEHKALCRGQPVSSAGVPLMLGVAEPPAGASILSSARGPGAWWL